MLLAVVAVVLSQTPVPSIAVVQAANDGVTTKRAAELNHRVVEALKAEGFAVEWVPTACADQACVLATGAKLKATAVVAVALAASARESVVDLEALQPSGASMALATYSVKLGSETKMPADAVQFAQAVKAAVKKLLDKPPDAPVAPKPVVLAPVEPVTQPPTLVEPVGKPFPVGPVVVGAAAVVAAAVAVTFLIVAGGQRASVDQGNASGVSTLTYLEAQQQAGRANTSYTVSLGSGVAAVVLAGAAAGWFAAR